MISKERKAQIARENGAKSKGPVTPEGKEKSARNAIKDGNRAEVLSYLVPPHSSCLINEERQAFYRLYDNLIAKYRPADEADHSIVREIADYRWKSIRNSQMESAIYNREVILQTKLILTGTIPETHDLEIAVAAQEALTGNKTIAELRRDSVRCLRAIALLQRGLKELQKTWPQAPPIPSAPERTEPETTERTEPEADEQPESEAATTPERTNQNPQQTARTFNTNGPVTENVVNLYRDIFGVKDAEFISHDLDAV